MFYSLLVSFGRGLPSCWKPVAPVPQLSVRAAVLWREQFFLRAHCRVPGRRSRCVCPHLGVGISLATAVGWVRQMEVAGRASSLGAGWSWGVRAGHWEPAHPETTVGWQAGRSGVPQSGVFSENTAP